MFSRVLFTLLLTGTLVSTSLAENETNGFPNQKPSSTSAIELSNGFHVSAGLDHKFRPSGAVNVYGGGKLGPGQQHQYFVNDEQSQLSQPQPQQQQQQHQYYVQPLSNTSLWSGYTSTLLTAAAYFGAGVIAAISVWYSCGVLGFSKKSIEDTEEVKKDAKPKSRRRRSAQADENLTNLANMVLAAIESGECLQKSICLMGSQVGTGKGRLAATLLDKMIPDNLQGSPYFVTFRNALRGEEYCNKIRCKH